ncbi:MAG: type II toxin-antitoxin system RatA family toxin [Beijerinckiaceae bacterium]
MPSFETSRNVRYSTGEMFDLVADVEQYPQFLPLCTGLAVRSRSTDDNGREVLVAIMSVGYKAIRERFTSKVTLDREAMDILVEYVDGPFKRMENRWTFRPDPERPGGSTIGFQIDYEFRSRTLSMVMGAVFERAFRRFAEAFEERADALYGDGANRGSAGGGTVL